MSQPMRIPYGQSVHGEEEIAAVVKVLRTSTQMGHHVREMERRVADLFAQPHGVMVNSGSSANYLAVMLLGLPAGSEVITPALTFSTTLSPLLQHGLVPVFVDVEPGTYNIDVSRVEALVTPQTRALMIPNLIGNVPDWDALRAVADRHGLLVIEDSADTLGATLRGTPTGARADICTTSFYGSHVVNAGGNGGMLCVRRDAWNERARLLRSWGRSSSLFVESEKIENRFNIELDGVPYDAKFVFAELGFNFEPSEMGAAFGLVQLDKLEGNIRRREQLFQRHLDFFGAYAQWFILPRTTQHVRTGWLAFPLCVRDDAPFRRRDFQIFFEQRQIQTRTVFTGNALRQPAFRNIACRRDPAGYAHADQVMRGGTLIGCHHGLTDEMVAIMHQTFRDFVASRGL